jgi:hypothetical protein
VRIRKGKLLGHQLQACDVINKILFYFILHFDLGYMDLSRHSTSPNYLSRLRKDVFEMIRQLGPPTFFGSFTSVESKWLPLLKCLYNLNSKKLGLNISFHKLEPKHVIDLIQCDPFTFAQYYNHRTRSFHTLCMKDNSIFGHLLDFSFDIEFQSCRSQHDHELLWDANAPIYGLDSNNAIENFVDKYISCDNSKLAPNLHEPQTHHHKTCRKKNKAIFLFHFHGLLWKKHNFLNHSQWNL